MAGFYNGRVSVHPSAVRFYSFTSGILSKLCIDIDTGEKWFRIVNGLISLTFNSVMAHFSVGKMFLVSFPFTT